MSSAVLAEPVRLSAESARRRSIRLIDRIPDSRITEVWSFLSRIDGEETWRGVKTRQENREAGRQENRETVSKIDASDGLIIDENAEMLGPWRTWDEAKAAMDAIDDAEDAADAGA